ncbi:MAG: TIR domain-containing protein [Candidatus Coproplasma sp.]
MKDKIFIAWSGSNLIASKIKSILETKNYKCTIGGNSDNSSTYSSVGDTVIQQIKNCNQAIVIFQNRADGKVSNNLFFELGYVLSMYGQQKIHCVKRADEEVVLPSDFDNSFVEPIVCDNDEQFVEGILKYFFARQKMSINQNKMLLINNRYLMHDYIQRHFSEQGSKCSDYELAQYILFYMQAAQMFGDEAKVCRELKQFKDDYHSYFSDELAIAVDIGISYFEFSQNILMRPDGEFYVERSVFRRFRDSYIKCREDLGEDDTGMFSEWAYTFISQRLNYAYMLFTNNPELTEEKLVKNIELSKEWGFTALKDVERLESYASIKDNNDHKGILSLFRAYLYRNLFVCSRKLHDEEGELDWLIKSKKERTSLKNNFEIGSIDSQLYDNFAMEYYLILVEYLHYADRLGLDEDDVDDYKDEIKCYIDKFTKQVNHSKYIDRIASLLNKL